MKVSLDQFPKHLRAKLQKAVDELTSVSHMTTIGETIKEDIYKRTKLGYGVEDHKAPQKKLKPLSDDYKKHRKDITLHETASPSRSNLTQTGNMLDSMALIVKDSSIVLKFKDKLSENKVKWNKDMGRPFFYISKAQYNKIVKDLKTKLSALLR